MKTIAIIGGGASGLMAAIQAARQDSEVKVKIIERYSKAGRKILGSGNGRCNFTNLNATPDKYNNPHFVEKTMSHFGLQDTFNFFNELGMMYVTDEEGRTYPRSLTAETLLDILLQECVKLNIEIILNERAHSIIKKKEHFEIVLNERTLLTDKVIIAVGSAAGLKNPVDNGNLLLSLGHTTESDIPALVPLKTLPSAVKGLSGIRVKGRVKLLKNGRKLYEEDGEILFKSEGLSGIAIFEASLFYAREGGGEGYKISLDLVPEMEEIEIKERYNHLGIDLKRFLAGILPYEIALKILKDSDGKVDLAIKTIKGMSFEVLGPYDFPDAQIAVGGVKLSDVNPKTLESKIVKGLFFAGEALNIDGECGGYNLQWAWSSGAVAGRSSELSLFYRKQSEGE
jgi:predicted Rossmann fold flavoprotein